MQIIHPVHEFVKLAARSRRAYLKHCHSFFFFFLHPVDKTNLSTDKHRLGRNSAELIGKANKLGLAVRCALAGDKNGARKVAYKSSNEKQDLSRCKTAEQIDRIIIICTCLAEILPRNNF